MDALTPWRPLRELETIRQRTDDMFERLTREFFGPSWQERPRREAEAWTPAIECQVRKRHFSREGGPARHRSQRSNDFGGRESVNHRGRAQAGQEGGRAKVLLRRDALREVLSYAHAPRRGRRGRGEGGLQKWGAGNQGAGAQAVGQDEDPDRHPAMSRSAGAWSL